MVPGTVVLLERVAVNPAALRAVVAGFGWSVLTVSCPDALRALGDGRNPVAVLFAAEGEGSGWRQKVKEILEAVPSALPIACHGPAEYIPWPDMADAGVFHVLTLPLDTGEARQSLGFVWAALHREAHKLFLMRRSEGASETAPPLRKGSAA